MDDITIKYTEKGNMICVNAVPIMFSEEDNDVIYSIGYGVHILYIPELDKAKWFIENILKKELLFYKLARY